MSKLNDCPFCNSNEPALKSNNTAQVLLSDPHKVPGHLLVMPKRHVEKPWELSTSEIQDIFNMIFEIEQKIIGKLGEGCDIRQNYRPYLNQGELKVDHLVFHLLPRSSNDYLYSVSEQYEQDLFADLDSAEANAVKDLLR